MKKFIRIFIVTTIILMLLLIGLLLFYLYKAKQAENTAATQQTASVLNRELPYEKTTLLDKELAGTENEEVIRGVIFIGDKEDESLISSAYFVNYDRQENIIKFFNIPGSMIFEVSNETHRELSASFAGLPQIVRLSHLYNYNKSKKGLKAAMFMLEDYLDLGIGHYLFLKAEDAEKIFYFNDKGESVFRDEFENLLRNGSRKEKKAFVSEVHKDKFTDISSKEYVELLVKLKAVGQSGIEFKTVNGSRFENGTLIKREDILPAAKDSDP